MTSLRTALVIACTVASPALAQQTADTVAPEGAAAGSFEGLSAAARAATEAKVAGEPVVSENWMVVAANPLAVEAGAEAAGQIGEVVAVQVIPRPHDDLGKLGSWIV